MREAEKRAFDEQQKFDELVKHAKSLYAKVETSTDANGDKVITLISGGKRVTRKEHSFKENDLKSGD